MGTDEKSLLECIIYYSKKANSRKVVFGTRHVEGISDAKIKIPRLLKSLRMMDYIEQYDINSVDKIAVTLTEKGFSFFDNTSGDYNKLDDHTNSNGQSEKKHNGRMTEESQSRNVKNDMIHEFVMSKFIKKRYQNIKVSEKTFAEYSALFKPFIQVTSDETREHEVDNLFEFVIDKIDVVDNENYIKILGPDGTGKSSFLSILYVYLYHCFCKKRIIEYPFYINLHYYDKIDWEGSSANELNQKVKSKINDDLSVMIELSKRNFVKNFLIIIDGNDNYSRTHLDSSRILNEALDKIQAHKKIICLGEKTNIHTFVGRNPGSYIDNMTTYTFRFSPIYISEREKWNDVIRKYCEIINWKGQISNIISCIDKFKVKEIDYNLLTIFGDCAAKYDINKVSSISELYQKYCLDVLKMSTKKFEYCIALSYEYFMTSNHIEQKRIAMNWQEWELIHQHKSVSNYLIAKYYAKLILNYKPNKIELLECVFTNGINVFLKSIINETRKNQINTIATCKKLFEHGDYKAKAQAAYLLGRVKDSDLQDEARELLCTQSNNLIIRGRDKEKKLEVYFLKRSICISLLCLEETNAASDLLKKLFESRNMNEVNRAFYLQYYDDVRLEPTRVNLRDDGKAAFDYTFGALVNYINNQLKIEEQDWTPRQTYDFQIYLFTLCSIIQVRLEKGVEQRYLNKLNELIIKTLDTAKSNLDINMQRYIIMLQEDINNKSFHVGHIYNELYSAKDIERSGWLDKITMGSAGVSRYENIVEHMYYSWLLGMLYLPEQAPQHESAIYRFYNKRKILDCLLVHDLAETYLGDKRPEEKSEEFIKKENECMHKVFMHGMYPKIGKMDGYAAIYDNFRLESTDINGIIAKEIDIIQALYQYCVYKRKGAEFKDGKDAEWKKEKDKIKTSIGKKILKEVVLKFFNDIL